VTKYQRDEYRRKQATPAPGQYENQNEIIEPKKYHVGSSWFCRDKVEKPAKRINYIKFSNERTDKIHLETHRYRLPSFHKTGRKHRILGVQRRNKKPIRRQRAHLKRQNPGPWSLPGQPVPLHRVEVRGEELCQQPCFHE
jgi:hypothetical protein